MYKYLLLSIIITSPLQVIWGQNTSFAYGEKILSYAEIKCNTQKILTTPQLQALIARNLRFNSFVSDMSNINSDIAPSSNGVDTNIYGAIAEYCKRNSRGLEIVIYQYLNYDTPEAVFCEILEFANKKQVSGVKAVDNALLFIGYAEETQEYIVNIWHDPVDWTLDKTARVDVKITQGKKSAICKGELVAEGKYLERLFIKIPNNFDRKKNFKIDFSLSVQKTLNPFYMIVPLSGNGKGKFQGVALTVEKIQQREDIYTKNVNINFEEQSLKLLDVAPIASNTMSFPLYFPGKKANAKQHAFDLFIPFNVMPEIGALQFIFGKTESGKLLLSVEIKNTQ